MTQSRLPWLRGVLTAACLTPVTGATLGRPPSLVPTGGTFEVTLKGAKTGRISGAAMFYLWGAEYGGGAPRIVLYDYRGDGDFFVVQFQSAQPRIPDTGAYPLSAYGEEGFMTAASSVRPGEAWILADAQGTLTLTEASDTRLAGTFTFTDTSYRDGSVTVEGSFDAPRGSAEDIPRVVR